MSGFVHPNVDRISRNFSLEEGFFIHFESNPFDGLIVVSFVTLLLFFEISKLSCIRAVQRRDARFIAKKITKVMKSFETGSIDIFAGQFACLRTKVHEMAGKLRAA